MAQSQRFCAFLPHDPPCDGKQLLVAVLPREPLARDTRRG
jgi:hypothetical protein